MKNHRQLRYYSVLSIEQLVIARIVDWWNLLSWLNVTIATSSSCCSFLCIHYYWNLFFHNLGLGGRKIQDRHTRMLMHALCWVWFVCDWTWLVLFSEACKNLFIFYFMCDVLMRCTFVNNIPLIKYIVERGIFACEVTAGLWLWLWPLCRFWWICCKKIFWFSGVEFSHSTLLF